MKLGPLLNPLRFAARRDFANLDTVKDLERTLARGVQAVRAMPDVSPSERAAVEDIAPMVDGLDGLPPTERRQRLQAILQRLVSFEAPSASSARSGSSGTDGSDAPGPSLFSGADAPLASASGGSDAPPNRASSPRSTGANARRHAVVGRPETTAAKKPPPRRGRQGAQLDMTSGSGAPTGSSDQPTERVTTTALIGAAPKVEAKATGRRVPMARALPGSLLAEIVGVGPKTAERFSAKGFQTAQDVLFFVPKHYDDRSRFTKVAELSPGDTATVKGEVAAARVRPTGRGKRVFELAVSDETGVLSCRFFRFPSRMETRYPKGTPVVVSGAVTAWGAQRQMVHPDLERLDDREEASTAPGILPVYGDVEGVPPKSVRRIVQGLAQACGARVPDILPPWLLETYTLPTLSEAIEHVHLPMESVDHGAVERMRSRLVFDELLLLQLALERTRRRRDEETGLSHVPAKPIEALAAELMPFELTGAQRRALDEISADLRAPQPMNRLLQGDVGSGKTAVALVASASVVSAGRQAAILAPTEILADQHFNNAIKTLAPAGMTIARLTGSAKSKERRALLRALLAHQVDVLVGTHALLEPDVAFADLGLAVVDEQHRFGVHQRAALRNKRDDAMPDLLVMTATPIPRTLTLTAYGDLRVSIIDELPPGRSPTVTEVFSSNQSDLALAHVETALEAGRQAYIVYPLVEASEKLDLTAATDAVVELQERFQPHEVGLLHGRMRPEDKAAVMGRFKAGDLGVLVSTTVIEVGVDVANATVMLVQHADRFGLSQLHQLRGRVGRGAHRGTCLLVAGDASKDGWARLQVLAETSDGFVVAERDLALRGPGELLGTRQSGLPDLIVTNLARDGKIVEMSKQAAEQVRARDPELTGAEHQRLAQELERRFGARMKLTDAG